VGTYIIGELPLHNALGFFCWRRSLKIHIEIKREFFFTERANLLQLNYILKFQTFFHNKFFIKKHSSLGNSFLNGRY
jgi:hypothetical protein